MVCFQACCYQSISNSIIEARFVNVLQELDYRIRDYTYKKKLAEYTAASPSFKLVISSGVLLLIKTEEAHVIESDSIGDKVENINYFVMLE